MKFIKNLLLAVLLLIVWVWIYEATSSGFRWSLDGHEHVFIIHQLGEK